ncbi:MAG: hypothetical protein M3R63_16555 [Actinomycetota bacterium]|nr:hypothetical protein [Actinomycetota bacterium]
MRRVGVSKPTVIAWKRSCAAEDRVIWMTARIRSAGVGEPNRDCADGAGAAAAARGDALALAANVLACEFGVSNVTVAKMWKNWDPATVAVPTTMRR